MKDSKSVKVINREFSPVALKGLNRTYLVEAAGDRPASLLLSLDDVDYINSNTNIFRDGTLTFEDADYAEVHTLIGNTDIEETAFSVERIRDYILNPTYEKMQKLIDSSSIALIERFRGEMIRIKCVGMYGISAYVERIIEERFREISNNVRVSKITLSRSKFAPEQKVAMDLEKKYDELLAEVETMKRTMGAPEEHFDVEEEAPVVKPVRKTPAKKPKAKTE